MKKRGFLKNPYFWLALSLFYLCAIIVLGFFNFKDSLFKIPTNSVEALAIPKYPPLDKVDYNLRMNALTNIYPATTTLSSTTLQEITLSTTTVRIGTSSGAWPVQTLYPSDGAILPFHRIIAYYGNFYSANMGVLGAYPEDQVLAMLTAEVNAWNAADPSTPALPALQYIAVTAQGYPGADGKYRARMPFDQIDKTLAMAQKINAIVFLDIQVGQSTLEDEIPLLEKYLAMPQVNLAVDPEFAMQTGQKPGTVIGTFDATDINYAVNYLAALVKKYDLPPKILIVHRFTEAMLTNYQNIETPPQVQIIINMDGWGKPANKISTYKETVYPEPVEFTGFKLFYHNDTIGSSTLMTPEEILHLTPKPIYIQYQ